MIMVHGYGILVSAHSSETSPKCGCEIPQASLTAMEDCDPTAEPSLVLPNVSLSSCFSRSGNPDFPHRLGLHCKALAMVMF